MKFTCLAGAGFYKAAMTAAVAISWTLLIVCGCAYAETRNALIVGNSTYSTLQTLRNPASDAALIETTLKRLGFNVITIKDATQADLRQSIRDFGDRVAAAGDGSIALFYYAGHGIQLDGVNYIIPIDARISKARDVVIDGIPLGHVLNLLDDAHSGTNLVILDACRDNPFRTSTRGFSRGLAQVDAPNGSLIAYATAPGQVAEDGDGNNSPYSLALAEQLMQPGLGIEQVFKNVRIKVSEVTRGRQVPWEEQSLVQDVKLAGNGAAAALPSAQISSPPQDDAAQARRDYFKAMEANTIESYDLFIRNHPASEEAKSALNVIRMLAEEKSWRDAEQRNTIGAYKIFLAQHPEGTYAESAKAALSRLEDIAPAEPQVSNRKIEETSVVPEGDFIVAERYDAYGHDLGLIKDITFADCQQACAGNPACQAVTYTVANRWCFLKERAELLIRNNAARAAYRASSVGQLRYSTLEVIAKSDILGNDIARIKGVDFLGCLTACENETHCRAFSYVRKKKDCWLKAANGPLVPNAKVDSGVR